VGSHFSLIGKPGFNARAFKASINEYPKRGRFDGDIQLKGVQIPPSPPQNLYSPKTTRFLVIDLEVEIKCIDDQGRIILPKVWREKYLKNKKAIVSAKGDTIEIKPFAAIDLTEYFDKINIDLKADLSDWHKVRKELRGR
jgi:hypothetical protein